MYLQVVECLKCHKHYGEKNKFAFRYCVFIYFYI